MKIQTLCSVAVMMLGAGSAQAAITALDLANYSLSGVYALPPGDYTTNPVTNIGAREASAVTYNWDTDTLFVVGDEGRAIVQVSKTGVLIDQMRMIGFSDTEGLTYLGGGKFALGEEREQDIHEISYVGGGFLNRALGGVRSIDLGGFVGNEGLEGLSYDPRDGSFVTVKELNPQQVRLHQVDWASGAANSISLFDPALGVDDLSDVQVLATVDSLIGSADEDNLLIISQESARILEVDREGNVLSSLFIGALSDSAEGITIDEDGTIFVVSENGAEPMLYTFSPTPVPVPAALWLFGSALLGLSAARIRR